MCIWQEIVRKKVCGECDKKAGGNQDADLRDQSGLCSENRLT